MENWEVFEKECNSYLKNVFHLKDDEIILLGGADPTSADLRIKTKSGKWINIEAKMPCAQAGQFVVSPTKNKFTFSSRNRSEKTWAEKIIAHLNKNFKKFCKPSSKGVSIDMKESSFAEWIKSYYGKHKKAKFFITSYDDKMVIFPTDKLENYLSIKACLRIKRSGSTNPTKNNIKELSELLGVQSKDFIQKGKEYFINLDSEDDKFVKEGPNYRYQFTKTAGGAFKIRRLGNTNNANVIFSVQSKKSQDKGDLENFKRVISE